SQPPRPSPRYRLQRGHLAFRSRVRGHQGPPRVATHRDSRGDGQAAVTSTAQARGRHPRSRVSLEPAGSRPGLHRERRTDMPNDLMKLVESVLAEKRALDQKQRQLIDSLNRVLPDMGYQVVPTSDGRGAALSR